jgi:hypothetical protein
MATVAALYRYPVKSFTPESRESLTLVDGRIAGDRVLGFRFADTPEPDEAWSRKHGMLALMHTPGVTRLRLSYDEAAQRLKISLDGALLVEDGLDATGRGRICGAVANFAKDLPESGLKGHPERLPLRLVGDGRTPRYQDRPDGYVTLHGRASVQALGKALDDPNVSELPSPPPTTPCSRNAAWRPAIACSCTARPAASGRRRSSSASLQGRASPRQSATRCWSILWSSSAPGPSRPRISRRAAHSTSSSS